MSSHRDRGRRSKAGRAEVGTAFLPRGVGAAPGRPLLAAWSAQLGASWLAIRTRLRLRQRRDDSTDVDPAGDNMLRAMFDSSAAGITEIDVATRLYTRVNRRFCELIGRPEHELVGLLGPADVVHPDDRADILRRWQDGTLGEGAWEGDVRYVRRDGGVTWARISIGASVRDADGHPTRCVVVVQDITASRDAAERLRASEELLRLSMKIGHIGTFSRDLSSDGALRCGPETRALHGFPVGQAPVPIELWRDMLVPEDRERIRAQIANALEDEAAETLLEYRFRRPGETGARHMEARARFDYDAEGRPLAMTGVMIDVTASREAEARIAYIAHHDALTGLPNRVLFHQRLEEALDGARRGTGFALLCLDLDRFKEVNDTLGHGAGDALLRLISARLRSEIRETDTLARLGGDEFAIIQSGASAPAAAALARRLIDVVAEPCVIESKQVMVGTTIGMAVAVADHTGSEELLRDADLALYAAKADGRGGWRFFEPEMHVRMQERRSLEVDLRRALADDEFELRYQPVVEIETRRITGAEALLRWRHPRDGLIGPDRFIPLAEENGLIVPLGQWALSRACADAVSWPGTINVAVNLSAVQFATGSLVEVVTTALNASGLDPARLELEITESVMLRDAEATLAVLHALRGLGVRIALDDFGTGYSSLSYLQRFPFDKVKIDQSFTRNLGRSRQSEAIVSGVIELCAVLEMTTTAEGVETEEQLANLSRKGCREAQGYLFTEPVETAQIMKLLERGTSLARSQESVALCGKS